MIIKNHNIIALNVTQIIDRLKCIAKTFYYYFYINSNSHLQNNQITQKKIKPKLQEGERLLII